VRALLSLFRAFLRAQARPLADRGIRFSAIGRRDRLPVALCRAMARVETLTAAGRALHLRVAIDYSARHAIVDAARGLGASAGVTREALGRRLAEAAGDPALPDVDLLIRTGGEQRLSDFLLWESAYAELVFTERAWPDFRAADLAAAIREFGRRQRRFGGLPAAATS